MQPLLTTKLLVEIMVEICVMSRNLQSFRASLIFQSRFQDKIKFHIQIVHLSVYHVPNLSKKNVDR